MPLQNYRTHRFNEYLLMVPVLVLYSLLFFWIWYSPLKYIVENGSFYIISGWKESRKIPVSSFTTIKKSNTPIAGPARGIKRIEIETTGGDLIIISPRDREEFIPVIWEINPQVKTPGTNRTRISSLLGLPQRLIYLVKIKATYPIISLKDSSLAWITCSIWSAFKAVERKRLSNCDGAR